MNSINRMKSGLCVLLLALVAPTYALAASVTTNQAGMTAIYSQASFGANKIDIRFNPTVSVVGPLNVASAADLTALFALAPDASPTVDMFFIDSITDCGGAGTYDGCAYRPGNTIAIVSTVAAGANGAELNAHELGHNLGLPHSSPGLMTASGYGQKYIRITPILVTPLPGALPLFLSGFGMLGFLGARRKA